MWPYWLMFLVPAFGALVPGRLPKAQARVMWWVVGLLFAAMMGFRHEVGGDWGGYLRMFIDVSWSSFADVLSMGDPGYFVLNWLVARLGGNFYALDFACAAILVYGTVTFCRRQPFPWIALLAAVPYMLIVVGMGYTRQSVALGFGLLGLAALGDGRIRRFVAWVAIAALFHKSAVLLMPIAALAASRNRWLTVSLVLASTWLVYYLVLADSVGAMWQNYVVSEYQSEGGPVRVAMNALPAAILLFFRNRLVPEQQERKLWLWMAVFSIACVPLVGMASTAVDRVALYLIPVQLFVFGRLPRLASSTRVRTPLVLSIVFYYGAVQFVWLHYAVTAEYWVPYHFMPLWQ